MSLIQSHLTANPFLNLILSDIRRRRRHQNAARERARDHARHEVAQFQIQIVEDLMHLVLRAGGLSHTVAGCLEELDDVDELLHEVVLDFEGHGGGGVGGRKADGMLVICFLGLFDLKCVFCI